MSDPVEDIDNQIRVHEDAIQHLKTRRNSLIAICRLPTEILCEIFLFASHKFQYMGRCISAVCGLWRSTALSCTSLWNDLTLGSDESPSWVNEMLRRSMSAPLTVTLGYVINNSWENVISAALENFPRITELKLTGICSEMIPKFLDLMQTRPARRLRKLSINIFAMFICPGTLFSGDAPALKYFETVDCFLVDWTAPWLHNVEELSVSRRDRESPSFADMGNLLEALNTIASLKKLTLRHVVGPAINHTIHLPHLTALVLSGRLVDISGFLRRLCIPSSVEHISMDVEWISNASELDDLANLLAAFNECSHPSGKILSRPFDKLSLAMRYKRSFSFSYIFSTDPDAHTVHLRFEHRELANRPPPRQTYIAVERTLLSFLVTSTPLSELRALDIEMIDDEESAEYQILLLASCRNVEHLTMAGGNPHLTLKQLGLATTDGGDGLAPTLLPHLRTLTICGINFGFAGHSEHSEHLDALIQTLQMRKGHNAKIQTLIICCASVDAVEALFGELVDRIEDEDEMGQVY